MCLLIAVCVRFLEKMIKSRLYSTLTKYNVFQSHQCGFRKGRNTLDNIVNLDYIISNSLAEKKIVIVAFLDFSKAFDKVWTDEILLKLYNLGIKGNIMNWLRDYLNNRTIQVKIN